MPQNEEVLTREEMRSRYGHFYQRSAKLSLDPTNVPERLWPLLPYAEFWGIADDWTRQDLVEDAAPDARLNLKAAVLLFDDALDAWLAGPEATGPKFSAEYVAFTALRMAADFA